MPEFDSYYTPFRAWNRLEPRTRKAEFDKVLECGVHDALWMLLRQWQFGEFQAEDTGSAIFAKVLMQTSALTRLKEGDGKVQKYSDTLPLERNIENMGWKPDYKTRLEAAFMFLQYLDLSARQNVTRDYIRKIYKDRLKVLYPLSGVQPIDRADPGPDILKKAEVLSNERLAELAGISSEKYFDGFQLYQDAAIDVREAARKLAALAPQHEGMIKTALIHFSGWFKRSYGDQFSVSNEAWNPRQLEYQFSCSVPEKTASNTVLTAGEYYNGDLDWYAFDVNKKAGVEGLSGTATAEELGNIKNTLTTVIPTQATFAGAPNSRWWQFENGSVDLGNINAETTDIAKLIFTEYALMYNSDWFIIPYTVPVGSLSEIKGIVVKDVFGELSFIEAAVQGTTDDWSAWGMFNLSTRHADGARNQPADTRLFIPPATVKTMESEPVEEVRFVRDETTNSVWAIESRLADGLGSGMDGYEVARRFGDYLEKFDEVSLDEAGQSNDMFKFSLSNQVPENWIPFLPVHVKNNDRAIRLQRAAMPRLFRKNYSHVRPRTEILRTSINENNEQLKPYFINEEEVPRAGVQVKASFQRTRWYNGAVVEWLGYRKNPGRGEGSSGLVYDSLEQVHQ